MFRKSFICMRTKINPSIISPYEIAKTSNINVNMPAIILVEPFSDANVGSVSRAMLNFCLTDLRIVNPTQIGGTLTIGWASGKFFIFCSYRLCQ